MPSDPWNSTLCPVQQKAVQTTACAVGLLSWLRASIFCKAMRTPFGHYSELPRFQKVMNSDLHVQTRNVY